jgi:hypothetical protein
MVGVEFEMNQSRRNGNSLRESDIREAIRMGLRDCGQNPTYRLNSNSAGYWHSTGQQWDIKTDASCGWEVASPALVIDDSGKNDEMSAVLKRLNELQPVVGSNCGTHVHFLLDDFRWQELQRAMRVWTRFEPFFYELVPGNRRNNQYCMPLFRERWQRVRYEEWNTPPAITAINSGHESGFRSASQSVIRESSFNVASWWRNQRVEIRLHSGTVNEVTRWIMLMWAMFMRGKRDDLPEVAATSAQNAIEEALPTEYICRALGLVPSKQIPEVPSESRQLVEWLDARRRQFQQRQQVIDIANSTTRTGAFSGENRGCMAYIGSGSVGRLIADSGRVMCGSPAMAGQIVCEFHHLQQQSGMPFTQQCRAMPGVRFNPDTDNGRYPIGQQAVCPGVSYGDSAYGFCRVHALDHGSRQRFRETRSAPGLPLAQQLRQDQRCAAVMGMFPGQIGSVLTDEQVREGSLVEHQCSQPRESGRRLCPSHLSDWSEGRTYRIIPQLVTTAQVVAGHGATAQPVVSGAIESDD